MVLLLLLVSNGRVVHGDALQSATNKLLRQLNSTSMDAILFWNLVALQACSNDYDPAFTETLEQPGTNFVSRSFAIVHGAMYDAADHLCEIHSGQGNGHAHACSKEGPASVAIGTVASATLSLLYRKQQRNVLNRV